MCLNTTLAMTCKSGEEAVSITPMLPWRLHSFKLDAKTEVTEAIEGG